MKTYLMTFVLISGLPTAAMAQNFLISKKLQSRALQVDSFKAVLTNNPHNDDPFESVGSFMVEGTYSPISYCWISEISARVTYDASKATDTASFAKVELIGTEATPPQAGNTVALYDRVCAGGSSGIFQLPIEMRVGSWSPSDKSKTWTYIFDVPKGTLPSKVVISYNPLNGWGIETDAKK